MIDVATAQQKTRPEMETWFQRAMKLDPDNYQACRAKLNSKGVSHSGHDIRNKTRLTETWFRLLYP